MKTKSPHLHILLIAAIVPLLSHCSSGPKHAPKTAAAATGQAKADGKTAADDDSDGYSTPLVADPIEPVNRGIFWTNHQIYRYVFHPVSKAYRFIMPKLARDSLYNVFDNARYPIRVVNDTLQGRLERAGQETAKFFVNSTYGLGGLGRPSDRVPGLENVPAEDTGLTFAHWGIGNGPYIVLPILGPCTLRDGVGLIGDYGLNPVTWVGIIWPYSWIIAIPTTNTVRALPREMDAYDAATENALDRYLAARTAYIQYRNEAATK
jgi:phospholipid-binding lipoprotein MlaA